MAGQAMVGWIVDVQRDFMLPEGRLYVRNLSDPEDLGAVQTTERIEQAVRWMRKHCDVLVYTGDWHGYDDQEIDELHPDPSQGTYPPHCMGRSDDPDEREGAAILKSVRPSSPAVLDIGSSAERAREVAQQAVRERRPVFIHKNRFDVFQGNEATDPFLNALREALDRPLTFIVVGVARDVCVTGAVDGLQQRGLPVTVVRDATWGLGLEPEEVTLDRWQRRGGRVVRAADLPNR